jgi:pimeloyl-ACP methyl ester carboxylesterase
MGDERTSIVLVHGAWHGAWCWDKVAGPLEDKGVKLHAVELPLTSLADDVAATRAAIDAAAGPVVLCGHSYGGVVVTEAGNHPSVTRLVYLCALVVEEGGSAADAAPGHDVASTDLGDALRFSEDGSTVWVDPEGARRAFYQDCTPADADAAVARLRTMSMACLGTPVEHAAWRDRPSTYALCSEDAAIHPELQRVLAARCTDSVEWPTGHSPFVSQPELVVDLLAGLAR